MRYCGRSGWLRHATGLASITKPDRAQGTRARAPDLGRSRPAGRPEPTGASGRPSADPGGGSQWPAGGGPRLPAGSPQPMSADREQTALWAGPGQHARLPRSEVRSPVPFDLMRTWKPGATPSPVFGPAVAWTGAAQARGAIIFTLLGDPGGPGASGAPFHVGAEQDTTPGFPAGMGGSTVFTAPGAAGPGRHFGWTTSGPQTSGPLTEDIASGADLSGGHGPVERGRRWTGHCPWSSSSSEQKLRQPHNRTSPR